MPNGLRIASVAGISPRHQRAIAFHRCEGTLRGIDPHHASPLGDPKPYHLPVSSSCTRQEFPPYTGLPQVTTSKHCEDNALKYALSMQRPETVFGT